MEFAKNFYIHDAEWDEVLKTSEKLAAKSVPAIEVLNEVLEKATVNVINKIPPVVLSSDSEGTLHSDDFETVDEERCSSDSSVSILEPIKRRKRDNLSVKPGELEIECQVSLSEHKRRVTKNSLPLDQIFCAVKTRMPVMIPLERVASIEELIDPRERKKKTEVPKELAKSALQPNRVPSTSTSPYRIPKKVVNEAKRPVRERLGPVNTAIAPVRIPPRERFGPSPANRPTVSTCTEGGSSRPFSCVPVLGPSPKPP